MAEERTLLFLVRHGETEWNNQKRYQGQTDVALNDRGRDQARAVAMRLAEVKIHAIYSSDLKRAHEGAEIIAAYHKLPVTTSLALRERRFGALEGLTRQEAEEMPWWQDYRNFLPPPGGESLPEMRLRVTTCVNEIVATHPGNNILIVTHGGVISHVVGDLMGVPVDAQPRSRVRLDNSSITIVEDDRERRTLMLLNDISHLYPQAPIAVLALTEEKTAHEGNKA